MALHRGMTLNERLAAIDTGLDELNDNIGALIGSEHEDELRRVRGLVYLLLRDAQAGRIVEVAREQKAATGHGAFIVDLGALAAKDSEASR